MSYEIIYDKQFIKADDKFVPMIYLGSNNCYDWSPNGRERRERSWFPWGITDNIIISLEEMLKYCEATRKDIIERNEARERDDWYQEYDDKSFGYWVAISLGGACSNMSYGQFKGIFITGCKKALTIEQLNEEGVSVMVSSGYYSNESREKLGIKPYYKEVRNTKELIEAIAECDKIFEGTGISTIVEYSGMYDDKPMWLRRKYFPKTKKERVSVEVDKYYTIMVDGRYLARHTRNGYRYSPYSPQMKFETKREAERRVKKYNDKYSGFHEVKEINQSTILYKRV